MSNDERMTVTVQVVGQASRLSEGRLALGANNAGETPGAADGRSAAFMPLHYPPARKHLKISGTLRRYARSSGINAALLSRTPAGTAFIRLSSFVIRHLRSRLAAVWGFA